MFQYTKTPSRCGDRGPEFETGEEITPNCAVWNLLVALPQYVVIVRAYKEQLLSVVSGKLVETGGDGHSATGS